MRCEFIKENGKQCRANSLKDDKFCFSHSEKTKEEKKKAVSKGGSSKLKKILKDPVLVENQNDLKDVLVETINELRVKNMSVHNANAIGYLSNTLVKILPQSEKLDGKKGWASLLKEAYEK